MSVINQVLNQLEQRGVSLAVPEVCTVQAESGSRNVKPLTLFVLLLLGGLSWWFWPAPAVPVVPARVGMPVAAEAAVVAGSALNAAHPASRLNVERRSVPLPKVAHPEKLSSVKAVEPVVSVARPRQADTAVPATPVLKQVSSWQQADVEFRKAAVLMQSGRTEEAMAGYEAALRIDAGHEAARQAWVALLLESKRGAEAEQVLQDGLKYKPSHSGFVMLLARLQVERGALDQAIVTLETGLPHIGQQADYQAFYAALLQRKNRQQEAVEHYQIALKSSPNKGIWLMGCGISLQALGRADEAKAEYQHALDSQTLTPELQAFVQQKLKGW